MNEQLLDSTADNEFTLKPEVREALLDIPVKELPLTRITYVTRKIDVENPTLKDIFALKLSEICGSDVPSTTILTLLNFSRILEVPFAKEDCKNIFPEDQLDQIVKDYLIEDLSFSELIAIIKTAMKPAHIKKLVASLAFSTQSLKPDHVFCLETAINIVGFDTRLERKLLDNDIYSIGDILYADDVFFTDDERRILLNFCSFFIDSNNIGEHIKDLPCNTSEWAFLGEYINPYTATRIIKENHFENKSELARFILSNDDKEIMSLFQIKKLSTIFQLRCFAQDLYKKKSEMFFGSNA